MVSVGTPACRKLSCSAISEPEERDRRRLPRLLCQQPQSRKQGMYSESRGGRPIRSWRHGSGLTYPGRPRRAMTHWQDAFRFMLYRRRRWCRGSVINTLLGAHWPKPSRQLGSCQPAGWATNPGDRR